MVGQNVEDVAAVVFNADASIADLSELYQDHFEHYFKDVCETCIQWANEGGDSAYIFEDIIKNPNCDASLIEEIVLWYQTVSANDGRNSTFPADAGTLSVFFKAMANKNCPKSVFEAYAGLSFEFTWQAMESDMGREEVIDSINTDLEILAGVKGLSREARASYLNQVHNSGFKDCAGEFSGCEACAALLP